MRTVRLLRRYRWSLLILLMAVFVWWWAFDYLTAFHPPDVPYVDTPQDIVAAMLDFAEVKSSDVVYDLGSGDGRIVLAAGRRGATSVGFEIDQALVDQSTEAIQTAGLQDRVRIRAGDFFRRDLRPATVVTMYLKPTVNAQLRPQLDQLRPGTRIVSHMFSMPGAEPTKKIQVHSAEDGLVHDLYLWITPMTWQHR